MESAKSMEAVSITHPVKMTNDGVGVFVFRWSSRK
jgi:hypothetical protein